MCNCHSSYCAVCDHDHHDHRAVSWIFGIFGAVLLIALLASIPWNTVTCGACSGNGVAYDPPHHVAVEQAPPAAPAPQSASAASTATINGCKHDCTINQTTIAANVSTQSLGSASSISVPSDALCLDPEIWDTADANGLVLFYDGPSRSYESADGHSVCKTGIYAFKVLHSQQQFGYTFH